jgi:hypothetical protein
VRTPEERFWSKVHKLDGILCSPFVDTECWIWTAARCGRGYGQFGFDDRVMVATHVALILSGIPVAKGTEIRHKCDVPSCVNPEHLVISTHRENMQDMAQKGRHGSVVHPERVACGDRHGLRKHPERVSRGERHYRSILNEHQVRFLRKFCTRRGELSVKDFAEWWGVGIMAIYDILSRRKWKHVV